MTIEEFWDTSTDKDQWDIKIDYKGKPFSALIISGGKDLWYKSNGSITVPIHLAKTLEQLKELCDHYVNGKYVCLRCGKILNANDIKSYQDYFAGRYCNDCWTREDESDRDWAYSHLD